MVQPKDPPLSVRLGAERLARIEGYAKEHALSRHLAILLMLDEGYAALRDKRVAGLVAEAMADAKSSKTVSEAASKGAARASRDYAKFVEEARKLSVPVMTRKTFNPQPKPGKKR